MSTNKTQNFGLHAWAAEDDFLRSEFNENFAALDGAARVSVGTYTGDGAAERGIRLGFRPQAVFLLGSWGELTQSGGAARGGLAIDGSPAQSTSPSSTGKPDAVTVTDDGFQVYYKDERTAAVGIATNSTNVTYHYVAFR